MSLLVFVALAVVVFAVDSCLWWCKLRELESRMDRLVDKTNDALARVEPSASK